MNQPQVVTFDVTYKCNLACNMCQTKSYVKEDNFKKPLSKQDIIDTARRLHNEDGASLFRLLGAEPLLHPDIIEIVTEVSKLGTTWLTTNGTLITDEVARDLVNSGLSILVISLHSRSEHYKGMPASEVLEKTLQGIENINHAKQRYNSDIAVTVSHVITPENYNQLFKLFDLTSAYDVDVNFSPVHAMREHLEEQVSSWNGQRAIYLGKGSNEPSELSTWQYWVFRFQQLALRVSSRSSWLKPLYIFSGLIKRLIEDVYAQFTYRPCIKPTERMAIRGDGKISICEFMRTIEIGSIHDDSLWATNARRDIIDIVDKGKLPICRECNKRSMYRPSIFARYL